MTIELSALPTDTRIDDATADLLFREARTVRTFAGGEVTDEQLEAAYDLAKWGPTAVNFTPLRLLVVRTPEARRRLAGHMSEGNVERVLTAPVSLVLAADTRFHQHIPTLAPHMTAMVGMLEATTSSAGRSPPTTRGCRPGTSSSRCARSASRPGRWPSRTPPASTRTCWPAPAGRPCSW